MRANLIDLWWAVNSRVGVWRSTFPSVSLTATSFVSYWLIDSFMSNKHSQQTGLFLPLNLHMPKYIYCKKKQKTICFRNISESAISSVSASSPTRRPVAAPSSVHPQVQSECVSIPKVLFEILHLLRAELQFVWGLVTNAVKVSLCTTFTLQEWLLAAAPLLVVRSFRKD